MAEGGVHQVESVPAASAAELVASGKVRVLDVRNPDEWAELGTIPGAILLPLDLLASAAATLPREGAPILVCCEHGIRSRMAARFLATAGFLRVLDMTGGMSCWTGPRQFETHHIDPVVGPSSWLLLNADLLRPPPPDRQREAAAPSLRALVHALSLIGVVQPEGERIAVVGHVNVVAMYA